MKPIATNSPWSNGVVEVFHKPAAKIIAALMLEAPGLHPLIYSSTAERAMNDVVNAYGFSPYILVYGAPRRLPIGPSGSTLHGYELRMKLQTIAQFAQTRIQSDLRIRKAASTVLRHVADVSIGDSVFYNVHEKEFHGPGVVVGIQGSTILVNHGNKIYKPSIHRARKAPSSLPNIYTLGDSAGLTSPPPFTKRVSSPSAVLIVSAPPPGPRVVSTRAAPDAFRLAMLKEGLQWKKKGAYKIVPLSQAPSDPVILRIRWVHTFNPHSNPAEYLCPKDYQQDMRKCIPDFDCYFEKALGQMPLGYTAKSRACVRGDLEPNKQHLRTDSPTVALSTMHFMISLAILHSVSLVVLDVNRAFLHSELTRKDIYVRPPPQWGFSNCLLLLLKVVYGLCDAPRAFYTLLFVFLVSAGCRILKGDRCAVFIPCSRKGFQGCLISHVDDLLAHDTSSMMQVLSRVQDRFQSIGQKSLSFTFKGIRFIKVPRGIMVHQHSYIAENVNSISMPAGLNKSELDSEAKKNFEKLHGKLNWVVRNTALAWMAHVSILQMGKKPRAYAQLRQLARVFESLNEEKPLVLYPKLSNSSLHLRGYSDASHKSVEHNFSVGGYLIFLADEYGFCHLLLAKSYRIYHRCHSTTASEADPFIIMMSHMCCQRQKYHQVLNRRLPARVHLDSSSIFHGVTASTTMTDPKVDYVLEDIRDKCANGEINVVNLIPSAENPADALTKIKHNGVLSKLLRDGKLTHVVVEPRVCQSSVTENSSCASAA